MKNLGKLTSFILTIVMIFCISTSAYAVGVNTPKTTKLSSTKEITLVRGSGGNFKATIPIKIIARTNIMTPADSGVIGQVTMDLERFSGTNTYELFYTVTCIGDFITGFSGNFLVQNTSILSPVTYKNTNVNQGGILATFYTNMVPGTFDIPSNVSIVKITASNLFVTLLESGKISASTLINTYQTN